MTINYRDLVIEAEVSWRQGIGTVPRNTLPATAVTPAS
jgi:hypothetical protein